MPRKYLVHLFLLVVSLPALSQEAKHLIGFRTDFFRKNNRVQISTNSDFSQVETKDTYGFGFGSNYYFVPNNRIKLRLSAGLNYDKEKVLFSSPVSSDEKLNEQIFVNFGLHPIIQVLNNHPLNLVLGISSYHELGENERRRADLKYSNLDLSADIGLSYIFQGNRFSIMPELKYGFSLVNAATTTSIYSSAVDKYYRDRFFLSLYFY